MAKTTKQIFQIKVTLEDVYPRIWRRFQVRGDIFLQKLHDILQIVMGWTDSHLHMFVIGEDRYTITEWDDWGDTDDLDETKFKLNQLVDREGQEFRYEYDFGDGWWHTLTVEKITSADAGLRHPVCLDGRRACPPEDVGGPHGYDQFLDVLADPEHEDYGQFVTWSGGDFDSEKFDLEEINQKLRSMGRGRSAELLSAWTFYDEYDLEVLSEQFSAALKVRSDEQTALAEELAIRKDVVTMLLYLQKNKVTGTQSTGNFPLKAVREISSSFVDPPKMEDRIGERVYAVRSESDVWPLYYCHVLASVGGLIEGGLGKRWHLTPMGSHFLASTSLQQVWWLMWTWWRRTNWGIAVPYGSDNYYRSGEVPYAALNLLLNQKVGQEQAYEPFADRLIAEVKMFWPIENQETARDILHSVIELMVINPLKKFGVLETRYQPHKTLGERFRDLAAFQITPFGRWLLSSLNKAL